MLPLLPDYPPIAQYDSKRERGPRKVRTERIAMLQKNKKILKENQMTDKLCSGDPLPLLIERIRCL